MQKPLPKTHDALKRRHRLSPPQRREGANHHFNDKHLRVLELIHIFGGMLTTDIIFELVALEGMYKNRGSFTDILTILYHHFELIERPGFQRRGMHPNRNNIVHRVSEAGIRLLKMKGRYHENVPEPYGSLEHQMIVACTYASTYIDCAKRGIRMTLQHEICTDLAIPTSDGKLIPDNIFILHLAKDVLVIREIDRATEPGTSSDTKKKTWGKNIKQYREVISEKKSYKEVYKLPSDMGAIVQVITIPNISRPADMESKILRLLANEFGENACKYFMTHTSWAFGYDLEPPKYIPMLSIEWNRHKAPPFRLIPKEEKQIQ